VLARFVAAARALTIGSPSNVDTQLGPLITAAAVDRITKVVMDQDARARRAVLTRREESRLDHVADQLVRDLLRAGLVDVDHDALRATGGEPVAHGPANAARASRDGDDLVPEVVAHVGAALRDGCSSRGHEVVCARRAWNWPTRPQREPQRPPGRPLKR
jgi:hypothetical protein